MEEALGYNCFFNIKRVFTVYVNHNYTDLCHGRESQKQLEQQSNVIKSLKQANLQLLLSHNSQHILIYC